MVLLRRTLARWIPLILVAGLTGPARADDLGNIDPIDPKQEQREVKPDKSAEESEKRYDRWMEERRKNLEGERKQRLKAIAKRELEHEKELRARAQAPTKKRVWRAPVLEYRYRRKTVMKRLGRVPSYGSNNRGNSKPKQLTSYPLKRKPAVKKQKPEEAKPPVKKPDQGASRVDEDGPAENEPEDEGKTK